jgi:hypothetical protein
VYPKNITHGKCLKVVQVKKKLVYPVGNNKKIHKIYYLRLCKLEYQEMTYWKYW